MMAQTKPSWKWTISAAELGRSGIRLFYVVLPCGQAFTLSEADVIWKPESDGGVQTRRRHFAARNLGFCEVKSRF